MTLGKPLDDEMFINSNFPANRQIQKAAARARGANGFMLITLIAGDHQARRVVSWRQSRPRSTTSREASVNAMTPTAAKVSPRWLQ